MVASVDGERFANDVEVSHSFRVASLFASTIDRDEPDSRENADDGNNNKELDQSKPPSGARIRGCRGADYGGVLLLR